MSPDPGYGSPSSLVLLTPNSPTALTRTVVEALRTIDRLHRVPSLRAVTVVATSTKSYHGQYVFHPRGSDIPPKIELSRFATEPHFTFAHEFAHFLDNQTLHPLHDLYASDCEDPAFGSILKAWASSPPPLAAGFLLRAKRFRLDAATRAFLRETLTGHELFARSYAQYVASKSDLPLLRTQLERRIQRRELVGSHLLALQWEHQAFLPIMDAMDHLFRQKGWL